MRCPPVDLGCCRSSRQCRGGRGLEPEELEELAVLPYFGDLFELDCRNESKAYFLNILFIAMLNKYALPCQCLSLQFVQPWQ
jgi:hypothetical protein